MLRPLLALGVLPLVHGATATVPPVSFNRDIRQNPPGPSIPLKIQFLISPRPKIGFSP
jgi:hypothetical protein